MLPLLALASSLVLPTVRSPTARSPLATSRAASPLMSGEPTFYAVYHTFKPRAAKAWWANMKSLNFKDVAKAQHAAGIFGHAFLPSEPEGPILCLWECKEKMSLQEFENFIDGPNSPAGGALINKAFRVLPSGLTPPSAWPTLPKTPAKSTGSFFWVHHSFVDQNAHKSFWEFADQANWADLAAKNRANGVHNHCFLPTGTSHKAPTGTPQRPLARRPTPVSSCHRTIYSASGKPPNP